MCRTFTFTSRTLFFSFAAGYNNVDVAEFLLANGADVNAQDKGGLIPLHNASSYGVRRILNFILNNKILSSSTNYVHNF